MGSTDNNLYIHSKSVFQLLLAMTVYNVFYFTNSCVMKDKGMQVHSNLG